MRLISAEFRNFRLLRDVKVCFGTGTERKLTVIRGANDSGKTTFLLGLQWVLYGDNALPNAGRNFRLYPVDWDVDRDGGQVEVSAVLEFEKTFRRKTGANKVSESRQRYRLERSVVEAVSGDERTRVSSTVKLLAEHPEGWRTEAEPVAWINQELPDELREVFFMDGDRALGFIQASGSGATSRKKVEDAIRSLLGLGIIDNALRHITTTRRAVNRKAKKIGGDERLEQVSSRLVDLGAMLDQLEEDKSNVSGDLRDVNERISELQEELAVTLQKGDRQDLEDQMNHTRRELKRVHQEGDKASMDHAELFCGMDVAVGLLAPALGPALGILGEMHSDGRIPSATIPVLRDRLDVGECICGESLRVGDKLGEARRSVIERLIEENQRSDQVGEVVTELYYWSSGLGDERGAGGASWTRKFTACAATREDIKQRREECGRRVRRLEKEIDGLPDTDVRGLRDAIRGYEDRQRQLQRMEGEFAATIELRGEEFRELERDRDRLLKVRDRGKKLSAEVDVVRDLENVLLASKQRMANDELARVSESMNGSFSRMIGVDPEQKAIVHRAEISESFDIVVVGPEGRRLSPDKDLNGASRRALTLAFILALAKVSGVKAPNVIDTPLGMASGYVRRAILRLAIEESRQLVLLLTHDEIRGCEDVIDECADVVVTFTNPAHYPVMLVNEPEQEVGGVVLCTCNHRTTCQMCVRQDIVREPNDD